MKKGFWAHPMIHLIIHVIVFAVNSFQVRVLNTGRTDVIVLLK